MALKSKPKKRIPKKNPKKTAKKQVRKTAKKKSMRKAAPKKAAPRRAASVKPIGKVIHFYGGIKVAVIKFSADVKKGTRVRVEGATTRFVQTIDSMQYDHLPISKAPKGKQVGVKIKSRVRPGDKVYIEK